VTQRSHRLAALCFADIAGYTELSAKDEGEAVTVVELLQDVARRAVEERGGRIVKFIGDAMLAEFTSTDDAVRSAIELRDRFAADARSRGLGSRDVRVGVHVGDIVTSADGDIYGDGVNVASRIQGAAEPGHVWVSEDVWRQLRQRPEFRFDQRGERELKGLTAPVMLYGVRLATAPRDAKASEATAPVPAVEVEPSASFEHSVAVLPFTNMSANEENEYFSDGITEEILMVLSKVRALKVISRTSVMRFKGTNLGVGQIAKELGVAHIVEGSVRRAGNRVRITAQLIEARSDRHLWAESYDRDLEDIFAIQSDVAQAIVRSLRAALTPAERERLVSQPTDDPKAYEAYLEARQLIPRRTDSALRHAIERLDSAVAADPGFALAWAARAETYALLPDYSSAPAAEALAEARRSARRALELDPGLGEAHAALGLAAQGERRWDEAEREFRKALELSAGYALAYHWYGNLLAQLGRFDESMKLRQRAVELDPLSIPIQMGLGVLLNVTGRDSEAEATYLKALKLDPGHVGILNNLASLYERQARFDEALAKREVIASLDPGRRSTLDIVAAMRAGWRSDGADGYWKAKAEGLQQLEASGGLLFDAAEALAQLGRLDEAFEILERLVAAGHPYVPQIVTEKLLEPLRADPRYPALVERAGLA
jgi:adenylate cyclase